MFDAYVLYNGAKRGGAGEHDVPAMSDEKLHAFEGKTVQLLSKTSKQYMRMLESGYSDTVIVEDILTNTLQLHRRAGQAHSLVEYVGHRSGEWIRAIPIGPLDDKVPGYRPQ